ncbi:MAG: protein phosphatase CheZ [Pseudodesulfovibrio sp.]
MTDQLDIIERIVHKASEELVAKLKDPIPADIQKEIAKNLAHALMGEEFYKSVNDDLRGGLKQIYQEVKNAKGCQGIQCVETDIDPDELFTETSNQLDAVLQTTEKAAVDIIDIVEKIQELQIIVAKIVKGFESGGVTKLNREKLKEINDTLGTDLSTIMVTMSFQDLTGQRIKKIINAIVQIEKIVKEVMLSTGLMVQQHKDEPEKDIKTLSADAKTEATSKLEGPSAGTSQGDVDDLLASLGLD